MERKQAGKVERKTVNVYVRLGTSAWSQSDDDARPSPSPAYAAAIVRLGWEVVNGRRRAARLEDPNRVA